MKVIDIEQGTMEWQTLRRCKITGTKLEDVMGTPLARMQLTAELIAEEATEQTKFVRPTEEMERGTNEEEFAIKLFEEQTKRKFKRGGVWLSEEYDFLAHSPDASFSNKKGEITEAVEVKNPDSKTAIFSRLANMIPQEETGLPKGRLPFLGVPPDYKWQCVNYFLVNPKLEKLHFLIHDARFIDPKAKLYAVTVVRGPDIQEAVEQAQQALIEFRARWVTWKEIILPTEF